jgi:hypothetical protein
MFNVCTGIFLDSIRLLLYIYQFHIVITLAL